MHVSIIIPVYNAENKIKTTLNSILNQDFIGHQIEILLINDGSTDKTDVICESYSKNNNMIRYYYQSNKGPAAARNLGIKLSKGKYIAFIDADDTVNENWLTTLVNIIEKYESDLVITGYKKHIIDSKKNSKKSKTVVVSPGFSQYSSRSEILKDLELLIESNIFTAIWNKLYKASIIRNNNILFNEEHSLGEDFLFNINYIQKCDNLVISEETPYNYAIEENSLSHSYHENKFQYLKPVTIKYRSFLESNNMSIDSYYFRLIRNCYSSFMELFHKNAKMKKKDKIIYIKKILMDEEVLDMLNTYNPSSLYQKILLSVMKTRGTYALYFFSRLLYFIKFKINKK